MRILIVRTDSIGDVMLTLPMAYYLKKANPTATVLFLGKSYTKDIVERCLWVDEFVNADNAFLLEDQVRWLKQLRLDVAIFALPDARWMKAAYVADIPKRIGTGHRFSSWRWANLRPMFSRKNSTLHEAQLNLKLLRSIGIQVMPSLADLNEIPLLRLSTTQKKKRIIVHPFSQGSALNWTLDQYDELVGELKALNYEVVISGTAKDQLSLSEYGGKYLHEVESVCGKFTLDQFIDYIAESAILLACSTGPLHIAASAGIHAVGLYVQRKPIHPGRWSPLGPCVHILQEEDCGQTGIHINPVSVATFLKSIMEPPTTRH